MSEVRKILNTKLAPDAVDTGIPGMGLWTYDVTAKRFSGSSECLRLRGVGNSRASMTFSSDTWWATVNQDDRESLDTQWQHLLCGAVSEISIHYRVWDNQTRWRWLLTKAGVSKHGDDDKPLLINCLDTDVTEIYVDYRDNRILQEKAERSEIALASAQQGLWYLDLRLGIRTESDTWRTMRGYPADSNYGSTQGWYRDIHPDDAPLVMNVQNIRDTGDSDNIDYSYRQRHANGEWRWIWSRGKVIQRYDDQRAMVLIGTDTDVTHIKEAETRYERLSNTLEIAIQAAGMGVWEWTLNAQVNVWDRCTCEIFGTVFDSGAVSHTSFMAMVHPDDRENLDEELRRAVLNRSDVSVDYRINHHKKGIRYIQARAKCHVKVGEHTRYVGIVWDITDMVQAEQERINLAENLSHAQRLQFIGELTGGIAHDFNNLLAVISGNAELLSMNHTDNNKFLTAILAAAQRGASLTQGLLAFSRKQALRPTNVNLGELVNNLWVMLDHTLGATISIQKHVADNLWRCEADPGQLENALINLIINARDAMPKGGSITISTQNIVLDETFECLSDDVIPGDYIQVTVSDSGTGMSPEVLDKSIDPFFTTKKTGDGHGLGLSMVLGFLKQSQGHITIDSKKHRGTAISLYLPRHRGSTDSPTIRQTEKDQPATGGGETILVVEDEQSVREMIGKTLDFLGYKTICVDSCSRAIEHMAVPGNNVQLILTDIVLAKGMNGFELGRELTSRFPSTRVIYMSGYAPDTLKKQGSDSQDVDILEKPFSVDKLADYIARQLQGQRRAKHV